MDIVPATARLCIMNLYLHGIDADPCPVRSGVDSLASGPGDRFSMVLTNPPFGKKSTIRIVNEQGELETESDAYERQDFWTSTKNKQLNFLQHTKTLLTINGSCAIVVPDNVLFEGGAGEVVRTNLLRQFDVHTLLRLPTGIFYAQGVKANVLFFDAKPAREKPWTERLWVYDLRTNKHFTLKMKPLRRCDLDEFVACYRPGERHKRRPTWSEDDPDGRWRAYDYEELAGRDKLNLDLSWLKDRSLEDSENLPEPEVLAAEIAEDLRSALGGLRGDRRGACWRLKTRSCKREPFLSRSLSLFMLRLRHLPPRQRRQVTGLKDSGSTTKFHEALHVSLLPAPYLLEELKGRCCVDRIRSSVRIDERIDELNRFDQLHGSIEETSGRTAALSKQLVAATSVDHFLNGRQGLTNLCEARLPRRLRSLLARIEERRESRHGVVASESEVAMSDQPVAPVTCKLSCLASAGHEFPKLRLLLWFVVGESVWQQLNRKAYLIASPDRVRELCESEQQVVPEHVLNQSKELSSDSIQKLDMRPVGEEGLVLLLHQTSRSRLFRQHP